MRLIKLDRTGHTETECTAEEMVAELEREMNQRGLVAVVEVPGQAPAYLRDPEAARTLAPEAQVTVMPQLAGG